MRPPAIDGSAFRQGFYWPTTVANAKNIMRSYEGCLFHTQQTHLPAQALQTIHLT
jgi:hypothetical protein